VFAAELAKNQPELRITIHPSSSMGFKPEEQYDVMRDGRVEMAIFPLFYLSPRIPVVGNPMSVQNGRLAVPLFACPLFAFARCRRPRQGAHFSCTGTAMNWLRATFKDPLTDAIQDRLVSGLRNPPHTLRGPCLPTAGPSPRGSGFVHWHGASMLIWFLVLFATGLKRTYAAARRQKSVYGVCICARVTSAR
jgi:hypothetical protein